MNPDLDYERAERSRALAAACGRTCGCDELCGFGESKAEAMKDERERWAS